MRFLLGFQSRWLLCVWPLLIGAQDVQLEVPHEHCPVHPNQIQKVFTGTDLSLLALAHNLQFLIFAY